MNYFVVAADGQKYGPADLNALNEWIVQGRLYPGSFLEEEATGRRYPASSVPGLRFAPTPPPPGTAGGYPRGYPASAPMMREQHEHGKVLGAFALGIGAILVAIFIGFFSLFLAIWGIQMAWAAKEEDHPAGWFAVAFNVLVIIAVIVIRVGLRSQRVV